MPRGGVRAYLWQCHATNLNDGALLDLQVLLHPARDADLSLGRGELEHAAEGPLSALRRHLEGHRLVAAAKGRWRKQEGKGGGGGGGGHTRQGCGGPGCACETWASGLRTAKSLRWRTLASIPEVRIDELDHWAQSCNQRTRNWPCASPRRHRSFISKGFTLPPSSTSGAARVSGLTHL